jgi:hypothetical protein
VVDYWQRWHISLTRFLMDYIYNPMLLALSRARVRRGRGIFIKAFPRDLPTFLALVVGPTIVTMAVAGIWHGAGWHYLMFGLLHGAFLIVNHAWRTLRKQLGGTPGGAERLAGRALTLLAVLAGFVMFRAATVAGAGRMFQAMAHGGVAGAAPSPLWLVSLAAGLAFCWLSPNAYQVLAPWRPHLAMPPVNTPAPSRLVWRPSWRWLLLVALLGAAGLVATGGRVDQFIYFEF